MPPTTSFSPLLRVGAAIVTIAASAGVVVATIGAGAATKMPSLSFDRTTVQGYAGVLTSGTHHALYVLSSEKGGHIHCTTACLKSWPPILVKTKAVFVSTGKGVKGTFGEVKRSATVKQLTFNGYPVYTFSGDGGAYQANGQGIKADGGTWTLINAGAKSASTTRFTAHKSSVTTTTAKYGY